MSVKHIEYLKVKDTKLLAVEIRPVKCLLDTPSGPTHTDKWMHHSHWKELRHMLLDIVDVYEEQRDTLEVECNKPKCKTGETIQIGYMFRHLPSCWCSLSFLTPRSCTWMENDDDSGKLQDKGGRFENLITCGEMLVISVILREATESHDESVLFHYSSTSHQQAHLNKKLIKALDSRIEYASSISDYFPSPKPSGSTNSPKKEKELSPSGRRKKSSPVKFKTESFSCNDKKEEKSNNSCTVVHDVDGGHSHGNVKQSTLSHCTLADQNPQGERIEANDCSCGYDQLFPKNRAKEIQPSKESLKSCTTSKSSTVLTLKKEHCQDFLGSKTESKNIFFGMKNGKDVDVNPHGNSKNNSETSKVKSENEIMKERKKMPSENLSSVSSYEAEDYDFFTEVKEEIFSDSESHHYECRPSHDCSVSRGFTEEPFNAQRSDAKQDNFECEASSLIYDSGEQNKPQTPSHNASLSEEVQQENVAGNTGESAGYVSCKTVFDSSFITSIAQSAQQRMTRFTDTDEAQLAMDVGGEGESFQRTDREYAQQRDTRNGEREKPTRPSLSSKCTSVNFRNSSEAEERPFLCKNIKEEPVESVNSTNVSSREKRDDVPKEIQLPVQQGQGSLISYQQVHDAHSELEEDLFSPSVEENVPQKIKTKTKILQENWSQERLMPQVNDHVKSLLVKVESYSADGYPESSQNCVHIQSNDFEERSSQTTNCDVSSNSPKMLKETHPSKKTLKSTKGSRQITQHISDGESSEILVVSDTMYQNPLWLRRKHDNTTTMVRPPKDLTENTPTNPESECISTNVKYPPTAKAKRSLFRNEDPVLAGNEAVHHQQILENLLSARAKKRESTPERKQVEVSAQRLDVVVESCRSKCMPSPSKCADVQSASMEEAPQCTSYQKSKEEMRTRVKILKSLKSFRMHAGEDILKNREALNTGRLDFEKEDCVRNDVTEILIKREEKSHKSFVEIPRSALSCALNERNTEVKESNSKFSGGKAGEPSLRGYRFDRHSIARNSSPEILDEIDFQLRYWNESTTESFTRNPKNAEEKQRNAHSVPLTASLNEEEKEDNKVESENNIRSDISPIHNSNQSVAAKRPCNSDMVTGLSEEDLAPPHKGGDEKYISKRVAPERKKHHKRSLSDSDYVPANKKTLSKAKEALFYDENSMTLAEKSSHYTQDLMERNSAESSHSSTISLTPTRSSMSEEFTSPEGEQTKSEEFQHIADLRRSQRIRKKCVNFWEYCDSNTEASDEELSESEWNPRNKYGKKKSENKSIPQQTKALKEIKLKEIKSCGTTKKSSPKAAQLKTPDKETNKMEKREGSDKQCKSVKKKKVMSCACTTSSQEIAFKCSCSKKNLSSKAESSKKNADMNYYNEIWNFSLIGEQKEKAKNTIITTTQKGTKALPKKSQTTSENPSKGKVGKKKTQKTNSNSDAENCSPVAIDDDFYWFIQAETERLNVISRELDETLEAKTSSDGDKGKSSKSGSKHKKAKKRRKSGSKEKKTKDKINSQDEDCLILNEVADSAHSLDSLRTSYQLLHNMTDSDLEQRLDESIPYLEKVMKGLVPNERHQLYIKASHELKLQQDYLFYGPFTSEQSLYVLDLLKMKLGHMDTLIGDTYDILTYRCRVLVPTFFTKIVMENENVSLREAHRLMAKFTLNMEIADDLQSNVSRKF